jgi:hypothetical protein
MSGMYVTTFCAILLGTGLVGCAGSLPHAGGPSAPQTLLLGNARPRLAFRQLESYLKSPAKSERIYVTDGYRSYLYLFTYPEGGRFGVLYRDLQTPQGECVDRQGNVWVANASGANLLEYPYFKKSPKDTKSPTTLLADPSARPVGCAIDAASGDLAATSLQNYGSGSGSVAIFSQAQGAPTLYHDSMLTRYFFCTYDDKGNLFVDGLTNDGFGLAELPKGSTHMIDISVNHRVYFPGGISWDGKYLAIGDQAVSKVLRFLIKGSTARLASITHLQSASDVVQFWLVRKKKGATATVLVAPDAGNADVEIYAYPSGGQPVQTFSGYSMYQPVGAAVTPNRSF